VIDQALPLELNTGKPNMQSPMQTSLARSKVRCRNLEESTYWLEILDEMQLFDAEKLQPIREETKELTAIFVTIAKKVKARKP